MEASFSKNLKLGLSASCGPMPGIRGAIGVIVGFPQRHPSYLTP